MMMFDDNIFLYCIGLFGNGVVYGVDFFNWVKIVKVMECSYFEEIKWMVDIY